MSPAPTDLYAASQHPGVHETLSRIWARLPSAWKALLPALAALLLLLIPADLIISSQFRATMISMISGRHQAVLGEAGTALTDFLQAQANTLRDLADAPDVIACAPTACTAPEAQQTLLNAMRVRAISADNELIALSFLKLDGARGGLAERQLNGQYVTFGASETTPNPVADSAALRAIADGDTYIFAVTRDARIGVDEVYQQPVLRFATPITQDGVRVGYLMALLGLDSFFTRTLASAPDYALALIDTYGCPIATSAGSATDRAALYQTWTTDPTRQCGLGTALPEWDVTASEYGDQLVSTRVLHGALTASGQTWTLILSQPVQTALNVVNRIDTLLAGVHIAVAVLMSVMLLGADRASEQMQTIEGLRRTANARDARFNPYDYITPVEDPRRFVGRNSALAATVGVGLLGGSDVLISGQTGMGKTSLLKQIERRVRLAQIPDPANTYLAVIVDLRTVPESALYSVIMDRILREIPVQRERLDLRYQNASLAYGIMAFREDLNEIAATPLRSGSATRVVLILDSAERWFTAYSASTRQAFHDVMSNLRPRVNLIIAGENLQVDAFDSTFELLRLDPMPDTEIQRIILDPIDKIYHITPDALQRMVAESKGSPQHAQRLGFYVVRLLLERDSNSITGELVEQAIKVLVQQFPQYA